MVMCYTNLSLYTIRVLFIGHHLNCRFVQTTWIRREWWPVSANWWMRAMCTCSLSAALEQFHTAAFSVELFFTWPVCLMCASFCITKCITYNTITYALLNQHWFECMYSYTLSILSIALWSTRNGSRWLWIRRCVWLKKLLFLHSCVERGNTSHVNVQDTTFVIWT